MLALATTGELEAARRAAARLPEEAVGRRLVRFLLGEWEEAAAQWQAALDHDLAAGDRHDAVANARWLADALLVLGEERRAAEVLHQGLEIAASAPQVPSEVWLRARLAGLATTEPDQAAAHLARCEAGAGRRRRLARPGGRGGSGPRRRGPARHRLAGRRGGRASRRSPSSRTTGCRGDRRRRCRCGDEPSPAPAGRTTLVPGATRPTPCSPGSGPRSGGGPTIPRSREAAPGLNATSTREHHTRAMTSSTTFHRPASSESAATFDAVVVGARCAGSSLAIRLARGGWRVAVVDKARFPSDTLSTHVIFPDGVARLDDLGVLKRLERGHDLVPARYSWRVLGHEVAGSFTPVGGHDRALSVRRVSLDAAFVELAEEGGATMLLDRKVKGLVGSATDRDPVRGVVLDDGRQLQARWVLGADGQHSSVAHHLGLQRVEERRGGWRCCSATGGGSRLRTGFAWTCTSGRRSWPRPARTVSTCSRSPDRRT